MAADNIELDTEADILSTDSNSVHRRMSSDQTQNRPSIRNRQRKLLGNFHFQTPVTPLNKGTTGKSQPNVTLNKRREQTLRAQR